MAAITNALGAVS